MSHAELNQFAKEIRIQTIQQLAARGFGHLGGSMSICEVLAVLYGGVMKIDPQNPGWEERDWLVCSKGHAGPAVYSALALKGYFPLGWLATLNRTGTNLPSHCDRTKTPGIDMTTGSLGQGVSMAVGVALSHKLDGKPNRVYCIAGDGECQEGQVWEAALLAAQQKLDNFVLLVDNNKVQLDGATASINNVEDLKEKFLAFGFHVLRVDGHDVTVIQNALEQAKTLKDKPTAVILDTVKGKGCSFAEGKFNHHISVSAEQTEEAVAKLLADGQLS